MIPKSDPIQLLIVGAGPVGLFAALAAARRGLKVELIDQNPRGYAPGYATLLHASSLRLLAVVGLAGKLFKHGHSIDRIALHLNGSVVDTLELPEPVLALPQSVIETELLRAVESQGVRVRPLLQATTIEQDSRGVNVRVMRRELVTIGSPAQYTEWQPVESSVIRADFVIGADGYDSRVRAALGIEAVDVGKSESFAMFEGPVGPGLDGTAHFRFSKGLGSVVIPLPNGRARFGFQIDSELDQPPELARFRALVAERIPWFADHADAIEWSSVVHFERRLARQFGEGRVWLAGDSAHITNPFGAQSFNVGLAEAFDLVSRIADGVEGKGEPSALEHYGYEHQREWHKLLGVNVGFDLLPNAQSWLPPYARRIVPTLPASGVDLQILLERIGLSVR